MNTALLEDTLTHIKDHPELHDQSMCYTANEFGLAACFGGRALLLAGYDVDIPNIGGWTFLAYHPETGEPVCALSEAQRVLGIDERWAENLFTAVNTRHMLERKVKDLLNGSPLDTYYELVFDGS